jgi:hypothetical protein
MIINTQLPEGLKKLSFEKNGPNLIDGVPRVRSVNYPPKKLAGKKLSFVKITFSKSVTKNLKIFITDNMEAAIKLVMVHKTILADLELEDQIKAAQTLIGAKKKSLADLRKPQAQASRANKDALV